MSPCKFCKGENIIAVEYLYSSPNHYDGISEWYCPDCGRRVGRWSGRELTGDEEEPRFGGHSPSQP